VTSSAQSGLAAQRSPLSELWRSVRRERALITLFDLSRQKSRDLRAARWYAFGVFVTYALAIGFTGAADRQQRVQADVRAALVTLSWVVGALASLGAARLLSEHAERDALRGLALQRGFSEGALLRASTLATAERIARLVGLPTLLLIALGVARGGTLPWALMLVPAVLVYVGALSLSLGLLAQLSAELAPRHPRALLAALVLCPLLISQAFSAVPSLPGLLSALLSRLLHGAGAA
jgi:hypothetical protein